MRHTSDRVLSPQRLAALQRNARKLCKRRSQRSIAKILGMNPGRFNHILRGNWSQVVITEVDLIAFRTALGLADHDDMMSDEARSLAAEFNKHLGELNTTASKLLRALRRM
jgi:hypothetical protein